MYHVSNKKKCTEIHPVAAKPIKNESLENILGTKIH